MNKLTVYLWTAAIAKTSLIISCIVTGFMVSWILGTVMTVSLVAYLTGLYLAEKIVHDEGAKMQEQMMRDFAKSLGGGTA